MKPLFGGMQAQPADAITADLPVEAQ